jgi:hypothetical protein
MNLAVFFAKGASDYAMECGKASSLSSKQSP